MVLPSCVYLLLIWEFVKMLWDLRFVKMCLFVDLYIVEKSNWGTSIFLNYFISNFIVKFDALVLFEIHWTNRIYALQIRCGGPVN